MKSWSLSSCNPQGPSRPVQGLKNRLLTKQPTLEHSEDLYNVGLLGIEPCLPRWEAVDQARIYARAPGARAQGGKFSGAAY